jgi:uncharacterized membrane protein
MNSHIQNNAHNKPPRFLELDVWRGIAVLGMVIFHFIFDLSFFLQSNVNVYSGFWFWLARSIAGSFILLAGISIPLVLYRKKPQNEIEFLFKRGLFLVFVGIIITLVTFFLFPQYTIWFGVLHAIGTFTILSIPFRKKPIVLGVLGLIVFVLGILFSVGFFAGMPNWIGIMPVSFTTFDYFPLFPWFGLFLMGLSVSHWLYPNGVSRFHLSETKNGVLLFLVGCGRNSLIIYLVHQPVLVGALLFLQQIRII